MSKCELGCVILRSTARWRAELAPYIHNSGLQDDSSARGGKNIEELGVARTTSQ